MKYEKPELNIRYALTDVILDSVGHGIEWDDAWTIEGGKLND